MKSRDSLSSIGSTGGKSSVKGGDGKQPSNERMLANFFNSLLQKKGPQAGGSPQQATPPKKQVSREFNKTFKNLIWNKSVNDVLNELENEVLKWKKKSGNFCLMF